MAEALKTLLLEHCYTADGVAPLTGYVYLAARHKTTNVGIFVLSGVFNRDVFKACIAEAKAAGLRTNRVYVYAGSSTYAGPAIHCVQLDDLGLPALAQLAAEQITDINRVTRMTE